MRYLVAVLGLLVVGCHKSGPKPAPPGPSQRPSSSTPVSPPPANPTVRPTDSARPAASGSITRVPELMGLEWSLVSLKGQPAATGNRGKRLTLRLTDDGIAAGFAGCNQFTAKFTNSGSELKLEPTVTTKMACPRGMTLERAYLDVLHQVRGWRRNGNQLELLADDQVVAVYERA